MTFTPGVPVFGAVAATPPFGAYAVNPDFTTYALALILAVCSGLFFGLVPVRQVLRSDPWQVIRSGSTTAGSTRRFTLRDLLLGLQIAICSVLVTASLVAVRGLARSLQNNYGIQPRNVMLVKTDLKMAGYDADQRVPMQKRMLDAASEIPGVTAVGYADRIPLGLGGGDSDVFTDATADFHPTNAAADAQNFQVSPGIEAQVSVPEPRPITATRIGPPLRSRTAATDPGARFCSLSSHIDYPRAGSVEPSSPEPARPARFTRCERGSDPATLGAVRENEIVTVKQLDQLAPKIISIEHDGHALQSSESHARFADQNNIEFTLIFPPKPQNN